MFRSFRKDSDPCHLGLRVKSRRANMTDYLSKNTIWTVAMGMFLLDDVVYLPFINAG
jgi:hypothetical protein